MENKGEEEKSVIGESKREPSLPLVAIPEPIPATPPPEISIQVKTDPVQIDSKESPVSSLSPRSPVKLSPPVKLSSPASSPPPKSSPLKTMSPNSPQQEELLRASSPPSPRSVSPQEKVNNIDMILFCYSL